MIIVTKSTSVDLQKIMLACNFVYSVPFILVFRNTRLAADIKKSEYIEDTGDNICDSVLLIDDKLIYVLRGRSFPHKKYQAKVVLGEDRANYIASQYVVSAWRKGFHFGKEALVQNVKFVVYRSKNMTFGDSDDYSEYNIVADNFHGNAPGSKGCVTVEGKMDPLSGDWKIAHDWIYSKDNTFFDACILNHSDLQGKPSFRLGSRGEQVANLQETLRRLGYDIKSDGDFGPWTHEKVRQYQQLNGLKDDGIVGLITAEALKIKLPEVA